jgi:DNA-binding transcriptional LysR family regulator
MDRFRLMQTFVRVAEVGSFSGAARSLRLSKAVVSKYIALLEEQLTAQLFNRTTRKIHLTEVGQAYLQRCILILADLDEAERSVKDLQAEPKGRLRINAPMSFGVHHLAPAIGEFMAIWPQIEIELEMNDRFVDLMAEGYDMAIRGGTLDDSSLIARRLAPLRGVLCGTPDYFRKYGVPQTPEQLVDHHCIAYSYDRSGNNWHFKGEEKEIIIPIKSRLQINSGDAIRRIVLQGQGIARLPTFLVGQDLQQGTLRTVLADYALTLGGLYAIYPHNRHLSAKVRVFVDFLAKKFGPRPYWDLVE